MSANSSAGWRIRTTNEVDQIYREEILTHWRNPQNYGELKDPDVDVYELNPLCGDEIRLQIKLTSNRQSLRAKIEQVRFTGNGCAISQAAASILTEVIKGKLITDVKKMIKEKHLANLGINPSPARLKCALLSFYVLQKALEEIDNRNSNVQKVPG